jgi:phage N-6-adenine-methyltransferase
MKGQTAMFSHLSDEWETPDDLFQKLHDEFHFDCDAAATAKNTKLKHFFGEDYTGQKEDALTYDWMKCSFQDGVKPEYSRKFFLNPPHSKVSGFIKKAHEESKKGAVVVCLVPSRTDTRWWHDFVMKAFEIRLIKGRVRFCGGASCAPFPSCIVVFDENKKRDYIGMGTLFDLPTPILTAFTCDGLPKPKLANNKV